MQGTLHIGKAGKLGGLPKLEVVSESGPVQKRLHVTDTINNVRFLIDTGADISLLPVRYIKSKPKKTDLQLFTANNVPIHTYGEKLLVLNLQLRRQFKWKFCVADVNYAIIGADFLHYYNLTVDLRNQCLRDNHTGLSSKGHVAKQSHISVSTVKSDENQYYLLKEFPGLTKPSLLTSHDRTE